MRANVLYDAVARDPSPSSDGVGGTLASVRFESEGAALNGVLFVADGAGPHPTVLLLHGFPGNERNFDLAHVLRRAGYNVLVFHYRGAWGSEGHFSFENALEDTRAAIAFLRAEATAIRHRVDAERLYLVGHSMGGFAALMAAAEDRGIRGAASLAGFDFGAHARGIAGDSQAIESTLEAFGEALGPLSGTSAESLLAEMMERDRAWSLAGVADALAERPLLLVAGSRDDVSPPGVHHFPLVKALKANGAASLTELVLDSGHGFVDRRVALARALLSWLLARERGVKPANELAASGAAQRPLRQGPFHFVL